MAPQNHTASLPSSFQGPMSCRDGNSAQVTSQTCHPTRSQRRGPSHRRQGQARGGTGQPSPSSGSLPGQPPRAPSLKHSKPRPPLLCGLCEFHLCSLTLRRGSFSRFPMERAAQLLGSRGAPALERKAAFLPPFRRLFSLSSLLSPSGHWCCLFPCVPKWPWHDLVVSAN